MRLTHNAFPSKFFTVHPDSKMIVAEASDLGFRDAYQLYDDACDVGICIASKTGRIEEFYLPCDGSGEIKNDEGELLVWRFTPANQKLREEGWEVHILND